MQPGDIILKFDGKTIEKMRDLPRIVAETEIGTTVDVELFRQGKKATVKIILGELEKAEVSGLIDGSKKSTQDSDKQSFGSLGFSIDTLTPKLARVILDLMPINRALLSLRWCRAALRPKRAYKKVTSCAVMGNAP